MSSLDARLDPTYLTTNQVAAITGFTEKALRTMRDRRCGPRYFKVGRSVRYRLDDIRNWIESGGSSR